MLPKSLLLGMCGFSFSVACGAAPAKTPSEPLTNLLKQRSALIFEQVDKNNTEGLDPEEQLLADQRAHVFFAHITHQKKLAHPTRFPPKVSEPTPDDPDHVTAEEYEQHFLALAAKYDSQVRYKRQCKKQAVMMAASMPQPIILVQNYYPKSSNKDKFRDHDKYCDHHDDRRYNRQQQSNYPHQQYVASNQTGQHFVQNPMQQVSRNFGIIQQETSSRTHGMHHGGGQSMNVSRNSESRGHSFNGNGGHGGSANHHFAGNSGSHHAHGRNHHK